MIVRVTELWCTMEYLIREVGQKSGIKFWPSCNILFEIVELINNLLRARMGEREIKKEGKSCTWKHDCTSIPIVGKVQSLIL